MSVDEVAQKMEISNTWVRNYLRSVGKLRTQSEEAKLKYKRVVAPAFEMKYRGRSIEKIAQELGKCQETIRRWLKEYAEGERNSPAYKDRLSRIRACYNEKLSIAKVAKELGYSTMFTRKALGQSPDRKRLAAEEIPHFASPSHLLSGKSGFVSYISQASHLLLCMLHVMTKEVP